VHYFRATLYGFEGKKEEAEREYRGELKVSPNHVPALVGLAAIDLEKAEVAEAGTLARQAADADPKNAEAHHLLGRVFLAKGEVRASVGELETAKRLAPDSPGVRSHLAMVYSKLGRTTEAKAESAAFLVLKNKEGVMAPPKEKLGQLREKTH
jgi:predicted Zn-dependent protease